MLTTKAVPCPLFSKVEILSQVGKIVQDTAFLDSKILKRFLLFIVNETLEGRSHYLKEYTIAVHVLDKPASFRPQDNCIVRIHAGRLRRAISKYYAKFGQKDEIRISIPKGNYVPLFENAQLAEQNVPLLESSESPVAWLPPHKSKLKVAVLPFRYSPHQKLANSVADGMAFQLTAGLQNLNNISVTAFQLIKNMSEKAVDLMDLTSRIGSEFIITGGVETLKDRIRVSIELVRASTFEQIWSNLFDKKMSQVSLFDLEDEIIKSILVDLQIRLRFEQENVPKVALMAADRTSGNTYSKES